MVESLLARTAGIRARADAGATGARRARPSVVFARSTRAGLGAGAALAAAALVERALAEGRVLLGVRPQLLLSGGGASAITRRLRVRAQRADDLVLEGLLRLDGRAPRTSRD
jgi:pantothenate kinase type III